MLTLGLAVLDGFYFINGRLYKLLEREDWPALADYLESVVIRKGRYSSRLVRLLANTYLVMSDSRAVLNLENQTAAAKPALVEKNALIFGAARVLSGDAEGAARFFSERMTGAGGPGSLWIHWYYGFSLLLSRRFDAAAAEFRVLASVSPDALVTGLSAYFLAGAVARNAENPLECREAAETGKKRVTGALKNTAGWRREMTRASTEIHAAILRSYMEAAEDWLFRTSGGT